MDNFLFFMIFYNMTVGLFSALVRVFVSILFNLFMISRLDRPILPVKWAKFDVGK